MSGINRYIGRFNTEDTLFVWMNLVKHFRGGSRKFRKRWRNSPHLPPEWKLHFSGHAAYSIVSVFVMQSKVTLTFRKIEREHFIKRFSKRNRKTFWKYKKKRGAAAPSAPPLNPPMPWLLSESVKKSSTSHFSSVRLRLLWLLVTSKWCFTFCLLLHTTALLIFFPSLCSAILLQSQLSQSAVAFCVCSMLMNYSLLRFFILVIY